jgi:hypothetical protein
MLSPANHFDCETVSLMGRVCDQAWLELRNKVPSQLVEENVHSSLAFRVLEAVNQGERNPEVLKAIALRAVEA